MATSANPVQAINSPNAAPEFPDQDAETSGQRPERNMAMRDGRGERGRGFEGRGSG